MQTTPECTITDLRNNKIYMRLQKYVADCGLMSRRAAEKEIEAGSFTVNGSVAVIGQQIDPENDIIKYKGTRVRSGGRKYYIALNKPAGYVTTASDEMGRNNVCELTADINARLYPVGRLDKNSEGLLIMTNDGEFAQKIMHPRYHLKKQYLVVTRGYCTNSQADAIRNMKLLEGEPIKPVEIRIVDRSETASKLMFVLSEGKNRQIRRMCEQVDLTVMQLRRIAIGNVRLGTLEPGCHRNLTKDEIKELTQSK